MTSPATVALIALPGIFMAFMWFLVFPYGTPDWTTTTQKFWQEQNEKGIPTPHFRFIISDVLETPYFAAYAIFFLGCAIGLFYLLRSIVRMKKFLFGIIFVTTIVIRCLSSFSGYLHMDSKSLDKAYDSSSPMKGAFLWWVLSRVYWAYTYLGTYADDTTPSQVLFDPETTIVSVEQDDDQPPREPPIPCPFTGSWRRTYFLIFCYCWEFFIDHIPIIPWRDAAVRLAYFSIIDNIIHVRWLRFFWPLDEGRPYTQYVNNSEILTAVLVVEVVAWICVKVCLRRDAKRETQLVEKLIDV